jgi:carbamate kinase
VWRGRNTRVEEELEYHRIDAVIDKDLASERLATSIGASTLVMLTNVDGIYRNYGKQDQELIDTISIGTDFGAEIRIARPGKR